MNGYIKLDRKMLDWGWYDEPNTKVVFLHLLLTANWKETEYRGHTIKVGQTVFGVEALSRQLGLSVKNVRTALEHLKKTGEITVEATNKFSIATLENWAKYQLQEEQVANNWQTTGEQLATPKESKKVRSIPPALEDVRAYAREKASPVDPVFFWDYYTESGWEGVKNWKQKFLTWDRKERERQGNQPKQEKVKYDF